MTWWTVLACAMDCTAALALSSLLPMLGRLESSRAFYYGCASSMLEWLPVLVVVGKDNVVVLNLHKVVLDGYVIRDLHLDQPKISTDSDTLPTPVMAIGHVISEPCQKPSGPA